MRDELDRKHGRVSIPLQKAASVAMLTGICFFTNAKAEDRGAIPAVFEGTGRACFGKLVVTHSEISWDTPFSHCKKQPYGIFEKRQEGSEHTHRISSLKQQQCLPL